jgi:ABC-type nitrate/sulfonate/bicarbonate transport system permease component
MTSEAGPSPALPVASATVAIAPPLASAGKRRLLGGLSIFARFAVAGVVIVLLWQVLSAQFGSPVLFPGPAKTAARGLELIAEGRLQGDILASLQRIFIGFAVGSLIGAGVGLAMGSFRIVADLLQPLVNFFRFIAPTAWIATFMVWFGLGETSKVALIIYATVFVVLLSAMIGVGAVDRNKIRAAQCLGANERQILVWVKLPAALPYILTGMRMAMMNSFMTVVSAEMIAAESGLGYLIYNSRQWMETDSIFVGMLALGVVGLLADRLFVLVTRTLLRRFSLR